MLMVADDPVRVEAELKAARLSCPACGGQLGPWGWGRQRWLRTLQGIRRLRPRRTRCRSCWATHLLLPTSALVRRQPSFPSDAVKVVVNLYVVADTRGGYAPVFRVSLATLRARLIFNDRVASVFNERGGQHQARSYLLFLALRGWPFSVLAVAPRNRRRRSCGSSRC